MADQEKKIEEALQGELEQLGWTEGGEVEKEIEIELKQLGDLQIEAITDQQHSDITIRGLYDKAVQSIVQELKTMKGMLDYHNIDEFCRLHQVSMALQHWEDDINRSESDKSNKWNPLSNVETAGGVFRDIAVTLRRAFVKLLTTLSELQLHLQDADKSPAQLDSDPCTSMIDTLDNQVNNLKICVKPLRVLSDRNRGVGLASETKKRSELLRISERLDADGCFNISEFDTNPRDFLPFGVVKELINRGRRDEVVLELDAEDSEEKEALVDYIIDKANQLFAIALIAFEGDIVVQAMESFREHGIDDDRHLPFLTREQRRLRGPGPGERALEDLGRFWKSRCKKFYKAQWEVVVPRFSVGRLSKDLDQQAILPFIEVDKEHHSGGFGEVRKVKIHEKHIDDPDGTFDQLPEYYALKHIKPDKTEEEIMHFWEKEASNLQDMMKRKVKNAVRFVTAFRRASDIEASKWNHYLICEWANGGSLSDVWKRMKSPSLSPSLVREVTLQLSGLADALVEAHYPPSDSKRSFMRHGDLKPDNILCFKGDGVIGTLKIGDWGLAKQKNFETMDQVMKSSRPGATVRYVSPETLTGIIIKGKTHNDKRTRLQDTWAMGCMVLEMIMWMLHGLDYVNKFYERLSKSGKLHVAGADAPFWEEDLATLGETKAAKVANVVIDEMDKIAKDSRCGTVANATAIAALLDLVRTRLLVVALPKSLGHNKSKNSDRTLRPNLTASSRQNTWMSDEETIAGTPTDSRSRANSPVATERYVQSTSQVHPGPEHGDGRPRGLMSSLIVPEVVVDAPLEVVVDEPPEEESDDPGLHAGPKDQDPIAEVEEATARALATELKSKLRDIIRRGDADDTGRYWFTENDISGEGTHAQSPTPVTKPAFGGGAVDSGYASGLSGTTVISTSYTNRNTTTTTYASPPGTGMSQQSSRTEFSGKSNPPQQTGGLLSAPKDSRLLQDYTFPILNEAWTFHVDNRFASNFFSVVRDSVLSRYPDTSLASRSTGRRMALCEDCELLRAWEVGFSVQYPVDELRHRALACELCKMFWETCVRHNATGLATVSFVRDQSWLKLNGSGPPVLSLLRDPYINGPLDLQMGFPFRLDANSPAHFEMMRQWLEACEESHGHPAPSPQMLSSLPTRLIDVGQEGDHSACLREIKDQDFEPGKYIALSHPWGKPPHFCTFRTTLVQHKQAIELDELPPIFRDAVITTRALGIRYLWIDSICIIQGPEGDFHEEARRMEQVFSAALCVIAASSSTGQLDGWLSERRHETNPRAFVSLRYFPVGSITNEDKNQHPRSIYISETIDDFATDVLQSPLSRRGWVLQERALARRTIFFTRNQTYFECGDGVRCMSLAKMKNSLADLLGDTAFPQIMMTATKGERIFRYQDFYRNYSRLGLTRDYDRPIAIAGLQSRLLKAFSTKGGFGIFDEGPQPRARGHLRRSLLWNRGDDVDTLERIEFPTSARGDKDASDEPPPPSWSWMAYTGGIDYLQPEFDGIDWEGGLATPWWPSRHEPTLDKTDGARHVALEGGARDFSFDIGGGREVELSVTPAGANTAGIPHASGGGEMDRGRIIFDIPLEAEGISPGQIKCVVLGRTSERATGHGQRMVYILVIRPLEDEALTSLHFLPLGARSTRPDLWRRIGAGYLPESCIDSSAAVVPVCIV